MNRKKIFGKKYKRKYKRGQINIAETVVSATVILVLSFSIAQLGVKVSESGKSNSIEKLKDRAQRALDIGLSSGVLRKLAYTNNTDTLVEKYQMLNLIELSLPQSAQFSLLQKTLDNSNHYLNNRILLGVKPIPSGNLNMFTVSVLLSSYYDTAQMIDVPFIITLIVIVGEF